VIVPQFLCEANVWPAQAFWHGVHVATRIVEGQLTAFAPSQEEIEQMILRSWLEYAQPAGRA
jgi:hypothetical protein